MPGRGVEGRFEGELVRIGNYDFCEPAIAMCFRSHARDMVEHIVSDGGKPVVIAHGGDAIVLTVADTPREGADQLTPR